MERIVVNIDSRGVRVFGVMGEDRELILEKQIDFAGNYNPSRGLHFNDEEALIRLLERVSANYFNKRIEANVSGVFVKLERRFFEELKREAFKRSKIELQLV